MGTLAGTAASLQARVNGELSAVTGHGAWAALVSFVGGALGILVLSAALPEVRRGLGVLRGALQRREIGRWVVVGGLIGASVVLVLSSAVPLVGVALATVALVGGQTASSLVVDWLGLSGGRRRSPSIVRVGASLLALVGVALASSGQDSASVSLTTVLLVAAAVLAGGLGSVQAAANARMHGVAGQPLTAVLVNMLVGVAGLALVVLGAWKAGFVPSPRSWDAPWWAFTGGLLGIILVTLLTWVATHVGILMMTLTALTGQLVTAVLLDLLAPTPGAAVGVTVLLGVGVTFTAATLAAWASRRGQPLTS